MSGPTLLRKGFLKQYNEDPILQAELDGYKPIDYIMEWFKKRRFLIGTSNRVLVLKSQTASGKSTAIPATIFSTFIANKPANSAGLICTQPRRITAIKNIGSMMQHYKILRLGENVGWATQYDKLAPRITASLFSATLGTLTQQLKSMTDEELCARYDFILIDECHERSIDLDLTIAMLKGFLIRNQSKTECPFLCLMSATFDEDVFLNYFNVSIDTNYIFVKGSSFPRELMWDTFPNGETSRDLNADIVRIIADIIKNGANDAPNRGDILIFLPSGKNPELRKMLDKYNEKLIAESPNESLSIIQISSEAQEYQTQEFLALDDISLESQAITRDGKTIVPRRRLILSTNVAETGLTLDGLKYVLDSGFNNETEFNPNIGISYLAKKPAPQSRITQRIGRVGRGFAGVFYPLYPKEIYDKLQVVQYPDILTNDITTAMLDIIIEQLKSKRLKREFLEFKLDDVDLMDSPSPQALQYAMERLYILGLISPSAPEWSDEDLFYEGKTDQTPRLSITRLGVLASKMICPALSSIESARMILAGFTHDVSIVDLITIAIYLQITRDLKPTKESGGGEINWEFIYEKLPIKINNEKAFLQARAVINDQFIEGIFLFESFLATIAYNESDNSQRIERWFNKSRCNVIGMTKYFLVMRDALIEQMLSKRINVFGNEKHALRNARGVDNFLARIRAIKRCIYDGYRANVAVRDEVGYLTRAARINEPSAFYARKKQEIEHGILRITPRYFVYNALSLARRPLKGESALRIGVELVSVMDGYVGIDDKFNI